MRSLGQLPEPAKHPDDPPLGDRVYYRSNVTGERGFLVTRNGEQRVKMDRPGEELTRRLDTEWKSERVPVSMTDMQKVQVAWATDQVFCRVLGNRAANKKEWLSMSPDERISFLENGPGDSGRRDALFLAIMGALKGC
jgi:hypothetical protein